MDINTNQPSRVYGWNSPKHIHGDPPSIPLHVLIPTLELYTCTTFEQNLQHVLHIMYVGVNWLVSMLSNSTN